MTMTNDKIKEIRERCEKASPGPWKDIYNGASLISVATNLPRVEDNEAICIPFRPLHAELKPWRPDAQAEANLDFIAHARQDVPNLLAEIDRLHQREKEIRADAFGEVLKEAESSASDAHNQGQHYAANCLIDICSFVRGKIVEAKSAEKAQEG